MQEGRYIVDFYCAEARLAVELDGGGHNQPRQASQDEARTAFLEHAGLRVMRFWNDAVFNEVESVLEEILVVLRLRIDEGSIRVHG